MLMKIIYQNQLKKEEKKFITDLVVILEGFSPEMQVLDILKNSPFRDQVKLRFSK